MFVLLLILTAVLGLILWRTRAFRAVFEDSAALEPEAILASVRLAGAGALAVLAVLGLWAKRHLAAHAGLDYTDPRFDGVVFLQGLPVKALAVAALWVVLVAVGVVTWQVLDNILAKRPAAKADARLLGAILIALGFLAGGVLR